MEEKTVATVFVPSRLELQSRGGLKPSDLAEHGHTVINPRLPDEDFAESVRIAQAEVDRHHPDVVVGSSRGGAVAMNVETGAAMLVLLCPAWKKWGSRNDHQAWHSDHSFRSRRRRSTRIVASWWPAAVSPETSLVIMGNDHRLAEPGLLVALLAAAG